MLSASLSAIAPRQVGVSFLLLLLLLSTVTTMAAWGTGPLTALVTGSSRGIGLGLVQHLLASDPNCRVVACARDPSTSADLQALASKHRGTDRLVLVPLDTTDPTQYTRANELLAAHNVDTIDLLFANAGISNQNHPHDPVLTCSVEDMMNVYQTNVVGTMLTLQSFAPHLLRSSGKVAILTSSYLGSIGEAKHSGGYTSYRVSKAALNMLAVTYAADQQVKDAGCQVLCMHPGWVQTDMGGSGGRKAPLTVDDSCQGILSVVQRTLAAKTDPAATGSIENALKESNCVFSTFEGAILPW